MTFRDLDRPGPFVLLKLGVRMVLGGRCRR